MIRRVWLNRLKHFSVAMVYARVDDEHVDLTIGDCNRTIDLSFDTYSAVDRRNSLHKIDKLVAVLTEFQAALHQKFDKRKEGA